MAYVDPTRPYRSTLATQSLQGPQVQPMDRPDVQFPQEYGDALQPPPGGYPRLPTSGTGTTTPTQTGSQFPVLYAQPQSGYAAPASTPLSAGGSTYATSTQINPAADLRSQQINPAVSGRLGGTQGYTDQLASQLANWNPSSALMQAYNNISASGRSAETSGVGKAYNEALMGLQGPDRSSLASQTYDLLTKQSQPQYEQELRGVGQRNAALGRIGAGMTTNDLGTVQQRREQSLANERSRLGLEAAGQTLNDRLGIANALGQGYNTFGGIDAARTGAAGGAANQALNNELAILNARRGIFGDLSGRESQLFGQEQDWRNETRGERDYQTGQSQQGIDNAVRQRLVEDQLLGSDWNRSMDEADLYGRLGYGYAGDPSGAMQNSADRYQGQADEAFGGIGDALSQYLASQGSNAIPAAPKAPGGYNWSDIDPLTGQPRRR